MTTTELLPYWYAVMDEEAARRFLREPALEPAVIWHRAERRFGPKWASKNRLCDGSVSVAFDIQRIDAPEQQCMECVAKAATLYMPASGATTGFAHPRLGVAELREGWDPSTAVQALARRAARIAATEPEMPQGSSVGLRFTADAEMGCGHGNTVRITMPKGASVSIAGFELPCGCHLKGDLLLPR